jgi:hypothetical protein
MLRRTIRSGISMIVYKAMQGKETTLQAKKCFE